MNEILANELAPAVEKFISNKLNIGIDRIVQEIAKGKVSILIQNQSPVRSEIRQYAESSIRQMFDSVDVQSVELYWKISRDPISRIFLLNTVRGLSPAGISEIISATKEIYGDEVSEKEINHNLDALRKLAFVVRGNDGAYRMSLSGLKLLGSDRGRRSRDVSRLLALARHSS